MPKRLTIRSGREFDPTRHHSPREQLPARRPPDDEALAQLARKINEEHRHVQLAFKTGLLRIVRIGNLLREAKALIGHGGWLKWIEEYTDLARQTAQRYMRISRILPTISNGSLESHLRQCDVLRLPSPTAVRKQQNAADSPDDGDRPAQESAAKAAAELQPSLREQTTARREPPPENALPAPQPRVHADDPPGDTRDATARHEPPRPAVSGDVERLAAEIRRLIADWPTGFVQRRALAHCLEMLAREVRATIPLAG